MSAVELFENFTAETCFAVLGHNATEHKIDELVTAVIAGREDKANLEAWAAGDARKIKRLVDMLVRADNALAHCGVPKKSPVRVNINTCLKET